MKITFRDISKGGKTHRMYNDPFGRELRDILPKPKSHTVKILDINGNVEEFYMEASNYELRYDLKQDIEELHIEYLIKTNVELR